MLHVLPHFLELNIMKARDIHLSGFDFEVSETRKDTYIPNVLTRDFVLALNMGSLPGYSTFDKFGLNPIIEPSTDPEDIWERGGIYPYDAFGTAPIVYISSSNNLDTQPITITGLDINGALVEQTITLTGFTNASLTTPLWRVLRLENDGITNILGMVYCHTDPSPTNGVPLSSNIRAEINNGNNQTLMALFTIPLGKVGFLYRGEAGMRYAAGSASQNTEYATIYYNSRRVNRVFKIKKAISLISSGASNYSDVRSFPDIIPSLTDIKLTVQEVSTAMAIWGAFDILLVDETLFNESYLQAIGQPGY